MPLISAVVRPVVLARIQGLTVGLISVRMATTMYTAVMVAAHALIPARIVPRAVNQMAAAATQMIHNVLTL